ncbi:Cytosine deaminase [Paraburkholderia tropica]
MAEQLMRQMRPMRRHEVERLHSAQRDDILIRAAIAHHAHALHRQEHRECLARQLVPRLAGFLVDGVPQRLDEDRVRAAQQIREIALHFAENPHAQTRARERVAIHHVVRETELHAQFADFVLEQFAQRLEQFQVQRFRQAAHVVVALDRVRALLALARRLDHIRIDRALREPLRVGQLARFRLEHFHEFGADDLALRFRIGHARQLRHERLARIDVNHLHAEVVREHRHDLFGFVQAQQAVIDEHAGQLVADRTMQQRRRHRRIHAARQTENDVFLADLLADRFDGFVDVVTHFPVGLRVTDAQHEAFEHRAALHRMRDFRVPLQAVEVTRLVGHRRDRARFRRRHQLEARRHFDDLVAVAHPHLEHAVAFRRAEVFDAVQEARVIARAHFGIAEFAQVAAVDLAAELLGHRLHAVADAEHGHAQLEHGLRGTRRVGFGDRIRTARKDDALRCEFANERVVDVVRVDFRVDVGFAHAARDQLGDLRTEVEDQDFVMHGSGRDLKKNGYRKPRAG